MADKLHVERLFALPYFQQMFDQVAKPMVESFAQIKCAKDGTDPQLISRITNEANKYVYQSMMKLVTDMFIEVLTDEDVDFLKQAYQHPAFLKLQANMHLLMPLIVTWFDENQDLINDSIKAAFNDTH